MILTPIGRIHQATAAQVPLLSSNLFQMRFPWILKLPELPPDPKELMVYELCFRYYGRDYYQAGRKEVRNAPLFDVWKQTTTLHTTLHQGTDKSGPVVGACVLRRGLGDLIRMLPTAHATGTASLADQAAAITRLGRFFAGHSWDSYAAHLGRDD